MEKKMDLFNKLVSKFAFGELNQVLSGIIVKSHLTGTKRSGIIKHLFGFHSWKPNKIGFYCSDCGALMIIREG